MGSSSLYRSVTKIRDDISVFRDALSGYAEDILAVTVSIVIRLFLQSHYNHHVILAGYV